MNIDGEGIGYIFYSENNPKFVSWDHRFDVRFRNLLYFWAIMKYFLIIMLLLLFVNQEQS